MLISRPPPKKPAYPSLIDAGPPGGKAAHRGPGGQPQLWRCYYEQRLNGRAAHGARLRQRERERSGGVHGGAAGGTGLEKDRNLE
jgi:hypothetical protein